MVNQYSHYLAPLLDLYKLATEYKVPRTDIPVIFVLHALRLSIAYQHQTRKTTSWLQGMLSVIALPISGGLVATLLTGSLPPFLQSDVVIPTYMAVYLLVHNSAFLRTFLQSVPPIILDLATLPADAILKASNACMVGVDGITGHVSASVKHNWFAPIFVGGTVGNAGYLALTSFNLFSPIWTLSSRFDLIEWDVYGPYILSFLYLALQGSNTKINGALYFVSQGTFGGRAVRYFTKREARVIVIMVQLAVQTAKTMGIWDGRLPGGYDRVARTRLNSTTNRLGNDRKDK